MRPNERIVIYGVLALLLGLNASSILGMAGARAVAEDPGPEAAAPDPGLPVPALTLLGEDGGEDLVLRNRQRRLSWGEAAPDRVYSMAFVYIGTVLNQLMQADDLVEERQRLAEELGKTDADYKERLQAMGVAFQDMDPDTDQAKERYRQMQALYQEYVAWQKRALVRRGKLQAEHLERSYRELVEAVEVVADRQGIDTVYRFIPTDEAFNAGSPEQAMLAIRLRTALRYPEALDITDDVLEELSLEVE